MVIVRLNDGQHVRKLKTTKKDDGIFGHEGEDGQYIISTTEVKGIRSHFDLLYTNHLHFLGKVQKERKAKQNEEDLKKVKAIMKTKFIS